MLSKRIISALTTLSLCASFIGVPSAFADNAITGGLDTSGTPNTNITLYGGSPEKKWVITGSGTIPVHLYVSSGTLSMTTTTGLTFTGSPTGSSLYFSGSLADINAALATLQYNVGSAGTYTVELSLVDAGQILYPANGHVYEVVNNGSSISATAARAAALARTYSGISGYLATITSQEENDFISARLTSDGWFGASDADVEGTWKWLDGPESGTTFWTGVANGVASGYENWANNEPNQAGDEDCSEFYSGGSGWNDLPCNTGGLSSYVVEYGAPGALVSNPSDSLTVTVTADTTTQAPTLTSPTSSSTQRTLQLTYSLPEVPTGGTVTVAFNNGTTTTTLTMGNSQSVNTTVNLSSLASTSGVSSSTAASLADGTYTVTLSYQDYLGNPASTDIETAIVIDTTAPVLTEMQPISTRTNDADAIYHFKTSEACSILASVPSANPVTVVETLSSDPTIVGADYTIRLSGIQLGGTYSVDFSCPDGVGNISNILHVGPFTVIGKSGGIGLPVVAPPKKEEEKINTPKEATTKNSPLEVKTMSSEVKLEAAPEVSCDAEPYLTRSIKLGAENNLEDVILLEQFLNKYENANLPVDGVYSKEDFYAVIKWQEKYSDDILKPWGIKKGTGYVYKTSLSKIKEIEEGACDKEEQK